MLSISVVYIILNIEMIISLTTAIYLGICEIKVVSFQLKMVMSFIKQVTFRYVYLIYKKNMHFSWTTMFYIIVSLDFLTKLNNFFLLNMEDWLPCINMNYTLHVVF